MYHYQFDEFIEDIERFVAQMDGYRPDVILAIARGGVTFGHFLSEKLNIRELYTLNSIHYDDTIKRDEIVIYNLPEIQMNKEVLVVDDIVDSGDTMQAVIDLLHQHCPTCNFKSGVLFLKEEAGYQPDFSVQTAHDWINFFWNIN